MEKPDSNLGLEFSDASTFKDTKEKAFLERLDKSKSASYIKIRTDATDIIYVINIVPSEEKGGKQNVRKQFG